MLPHLLDGFVAIFKDNKAWKLDPSRKQVACRRLFDIQQRWHSCGTFEFTSPFNETTEKPHCMMFMHGVVQAVLFMNCE